MVRPLQAGAAPNDHKISAGVALLRECLSIQLAAVSQCTRAFMLIHYPSGTLC